MVFSFFRKPKPEEAAPKTAAPQTVSPKPPAGGPATVSPGGPATQSRAARNEEIVVFDTVSAEACSAVEEAAVYYANNLGAQAVTTLAHYLQDHPDKREMQPWLMLFDLYQIQDNAKAFNELSMEFVVKFERSAPVWKAPAAATPPPPPKKAAPAPAGFVSLGETLAPGAQLDELCKLARDPAKTPGIDLRTLASAEQGGCEQMRATLYDCRKKGRTVRFEGIEKLVEVLQKNIATAGHGEEDRPAWLLLFEVYQWLGKEAEYEDLAIEYAVAFEISPPAWEEAKQALATLPDKPAEPAPKPETRDEDAFTMHGVISEGSQAQLQELANFAAGRDEIRINMSDVPRVDFGAVGTFMGALLGLTQSGKKILILEANEMVQALFNVMGFSEFATLMRKKPR